MQNSNQQPLVALRSASDCLVGSPYLFPEDESGLQRLEEIGISLLDIQRKLDQLTNVEGLPKPLKRILKSREIYESNAIEGVGPDFGSTVRILDETSEMQNFVQWALEQGIKNDRHAYDVIGLAAARELSRMFAVDVSRPITEADIRTLHKMIMEGHPSAGLYKPYANSLEGNEEHQTSLPIETPAKMQEFCNWMNNLPRKGYQTLSSIVKAAAVHAWIAHIHPFEDGNGRVSRLLANLVLAREGMPPLILRSKGDRERYINALSFSDEAGDISRLILLFCRSAERIIDELLEPQVAQEFFDADIDLRLSGEFKYWQNAMKEFSELLLVKLRLANLRGDIVGGLTPSDFKALRKRKKANRAWYLNIRTLDSESISGLWYFGYLEDWATTKVAGDEIFPCLIFMIPNPEINAITPYIKPKNRERRNVVGVMIEPYTQNAYVWGERFAAIRKVSYEEAADLVIKTSLDYSLSPEVII